MSDPFGDTRDPLVKSMAKADFERWGNERKALEAEIARLRELKTPASRQLLNIAITAGEDAEAECAKLRAALEQALENIANNRVPRQNIAGPIRAALAKDER